MVRAEVEPVDSGSRAPRLGDRFARRPRSGARVGTGSLRRGAQIAGRRRDLAVVPLRGTSIPGCASSRPAKSTPWCSRPPASSVSASRFPRGSDRPSSSSRRRAGCARARGRRGECGWSSRRPPRRSAPGAAMRSREELLAGSRRELRRPGRRARTSRGRRCGIDPRADRSGRAPRRSPRPPRSPRRIDRRRGRSRRPPRRPTHRRRGPRDPRRDRARERIERRDQGSSISPRAITTALPPTSTRSTRSESPRTRAWSVDGRSISTPCSITTSSPNRTRPCRAR